MSEIRSQEEFEEALEFAETHRAQLIVERAHVVQAYPVTMGQTKITELSGKIQRIEDIIMAIKWAMGDGTLLI